MMKYFKLILVLLISLPFASKAQYIEGGAFLGATTYGGDLAHDNFSFKEANLGYGLLLRYNAMDYVSVTARLYHGTISGDDANAKTETLRERNLSFRSPITEFSITPEVYVLGYNPYDRLFSPYLFAGVGFYRFAPEALYEGDWIQLQPLGTEGQGLDGYGGRYELSGISFQFGGGLKLSITEYINVGLEIGFRNGNTDYLDDVSGAYVDRDVLLIGSGELAANLANRQGEYFGTEPVNATGNRGNPQDSDWFVFNGITITYNFLDGFGGGRKYGCPTNF